MGPRLGFLALAALLLAGCSDGDWTYMTRYDSAPAAEAATAPAAAVLDGLADDAAAR